MTVNGIEKELLLEFIETHQKSEAHLVKKWNECAEFLAVELDDHMKNHWINKKEDLRKKLGKNGRENQPAGRGSWRHRL